MVRLYEELRRGEKVLILLPEKVFEAEDVTFASAVDGFSSLLLFTVVTLRSMLDRDTVAVCSVITRAVLVEEILCL